MDAPKGCTFVAAAHRRRHWPAFTMSCLYITSYISGCNTLGKCTVIDIVHVETGGLDGDGSCATLRISAGPTYDGLVGVDVIILTSLSDISFSNVDTCSTRGSCIVNISDISCRLL